MHKVRATTETYYCDFCGKLIMMEDFWLVPIEPLKAFSYAISMEENKMCTLCYFRQGKQPKSRTKIQQIDAFPDYPAKQ